MNRKVILNSRVGRPLGLVAALAAAVAMVFTFASSSSAQVLPGPNAFVSNLDLECWQTNPYTPPFPPILTHHLNPVLAGLPDESVTLGPRQQLCVPVQKNNAVPPPAVINFIRYVDLSCYAIQGINVNGQLNLKQLNPVLAGLPPQNVVMTVPQQLCVPVIKNGDVPPADVLALVQYIDLKCYAITPPFYAGFQLTLTQLDPVLSGVPPQQAVMQSSRQLCVPVQKDNQAIPPAVLNIVRWIDLEKFDLAVASPTPVITLKLNHINPLLRGLPTETATISGPFQLAVPVAKNGAIPPPM